MHGRLEFGEPQAPAAPPPCPAARATDCGHRHLPADTPPTQPHSRGTADASQPPRRLGRKRPRPRIRLDPDGQGGGRSAARASTVSAHGGLAAVLAGTLVPSLARLQPTRLCPQYLLWLLEEPGPTSAQAWEGGREGDPEPEQAAGEEGSGSSRLGHVPHRLCRAPSAQALGSSLQDRP